MAFLDPVLSPLLALNPLLAVLIISLIISGFIVLMYKKFTDQSLMKRLKAEIKELQAEMKQLKDNPKKMMEVQKKAMDTNMKYMMHSFRPTLFTFIPIILIFGWLNSHMGYYPLIEDTEFSIMAQFDEGAPESIEMINVPDGIVLLDDPEQRILDRKATWALKGDADTYSLSYKMGESAFDHSLIITESIDIREYAKPNLNAKELGVKESSLKTLTISNKKIHPLQTVPLLGSIPWIGGFGWLGTYILFSLIFSISLRKIFKVY